MLGAFAGERSGLGLLLVLCPVLWYAVIRHGGVLAIDRYVVGLLLGVGGAVYYLRRKRNYDFAPYLSAWLRWPLSFFLTYAAFQLVPLPLGVLRMLSPARAAIAESVGGRWAPLALQPASTLLELWTLVSCVLVFLLVREMTWNLERRRWLAVLPVVVIASIEAALGLAQFASNRLDVVAQGTYVNRNHFSGLLEMALPMAIGCAIAGKLTHRARRTQTWGPALKTGAALGAAALILAGIAHSLSRMGFSAGVTGVATMGVMLAWHRSRLRSPRVPSRRGWLTAAAAMVLAGILLTFVYLPPDRLIARFGRLAAIEEISADLRLEIWRESLRVVANYPVFGCGLGSYKAAFTNFKKVAPMHTVDYAHNDYLQRLAELGGVGIVVCTLITAAVLWRVSRGAPPTLAAACSGALAAIAIHSFVDFNLYIPANAMVVAWIAGVGTQ